jgi:hypothetical protein
MQVDFKPKDAYTDKVSGKVAAARSQRAAVQAKRDKDIIDTVSFSNKTQKKRGEVTASVDRVNLSTKMSVDDINRLLESEVGKKVKQLFEDADINPAAVADTDWSPEAVADRIFRGSTGLFEIWRGQHSEMSEKELVDSFEKVLRKSVDQGASEAVGLISARNFDDEDALIQTAEDTIALVHQKFDDYFADLRDKLSGDQNGTSPASTSA